MCGICGYTGAEVPGLLVRMCEAIRHRGPDARGLLDRNDCHLGCQRLRVLDLADGDQPIFSEDGAVGVVYNGEIYNFRALRAELAAAGHQLRTESDTEVIVHLYEELGPGCVSRLEGMFAFALYDAPRRRLLLARDPLGIKPLYYTRAAQGLVFASEVKSILQHPGVSAELDPEALHLLFNVRFVPGPLSLFRGIRQLRPGHLLVVEGSEVREQPYADWRIPTLAGLDVDGAAEELRGHLARAVARQMVADVPVGIYLSGGLDSSAIVAGAAASLPAERLETFALGFDEPTDELASAATVARFFGTNHHETVLEPRPLALYPRVVYHTEAPKVNALQGYYLAQFARRRVTVALSGLGGDELFLGYDIYRLLTPGRLLIDSAVAPLARRAAPAVDRVAGLVGRLGGLRAENARRAVELLACGGDALRYWATLRNAWDLRPGARRELYTDAWAKVVDCDTRRALGACFDDGDRPFVEQVQWAELRSKMIDDFLLNEDRMSMACSLEVRVPLLDLELVRFALGLPLQLRFPGRRPKALLRAALRGLVPESTLRKRKWGFTFNPYYQFRKDLRELAERELDRGFVERQGIFRYSFVRAVLDHRPTPLLRWHYFMLWQMLGLKFWQEIFLERRDWREIEERLAAGGQG